MVFYNLPCSVKKVSLILVTVLFFTAAAQPAGQQVAAGESSVVREVPESIISSARRQKEFAYANDPAYWYWMQEREDGSGSSIGQLSPIVRIVFYLLLITALVYALYKIIVVNKLYLFYSSKKRSSSIMQGEASEEENLEEKIREAIKLQQYRLAIRYMYLKTLKLLDEKGRITFNAKSTNIDYINAMNKYPAGEEFRYITRSYEYVWYGELEVNTGYFDYLNRKFQQFYKSL